MKVAQLFESEPDQWGLRGDPYLWREMKERFRNVNVPSSRESFRAVLEEEYRRFTGYLSSEGGKVSIEQHRYHGMSAGLVSAEFWAETATPLLISRYQEYKAVKPQKLGG